MLRDFFKTIILFTTQLKTKNKANQALKVKKNISVFYLTAENQPVSGSREKRMFSEFMFKKDIFRAKLQFWMSNFVSIW